MDDDVDNRIDGNIDGYVGDDCWRRLVVLSGIDVWWRHLMIGK